MALALLIGVGANAQSSPQLRLFLPANVPSEKVEIRYALFGAFGGYSSFLGPKPDSALVEVPLAVDGEIADEIKAIAWAPGCRMATYDLKVEGLDLHESYSCDPLPFAVLTGQVEKSALPRHRGPVEIRVEYLASWACDFFGFDDCMVPQFSIGTAEIDLTGHFEIDLPDFSSDPVCKSSSAVSGFQIALQELKTRDTDLVPQPKPLRTLGGGLKPASAYPSPTLFLAQKQN
jgi:hypothetical protein